MDKIPAHTTFVSADNGGKYAGGKVTWTKKVADGETFKVTFTVMELLQKILKVKSLAYSLS